MINKKRKRIMLSKKQTFELWTWVTNNLATIQGIGRIEISARATKELGFAVTYSLVRTAFEELGIAIRPVTGKADRIQIVAEALVLLFDTLGEKAHDTLMDMLNQNTTNDANND